MKDKPRKSREQFGKELVESVLRTFRETYQMHAHGHSKDAILIVHDIYAAASDQAPEIIAVHRRAIESAINAVDMKVPLPVAHAYTRKRMLSRLEELIDEAYKQGT